MFEHQPPGMVSPGQPGAAVTPEPESLSYAQGTPGIRTDFPGCCDSNPVCHNERKVR